MGFLEGVLVFERLLPDTLDAVSGHRLLDEHPKRDRVSSNKPLNAAAQTLGKTGTVIGPRGWVDHYLKHKLIHQWQAQKIGDIRMLLASEWIAEGMAC